MSEGGPFLGHRPLISKKPKVWANYHVWQSWPEVDARRRAVGSALHKLFQTKELGGGPLDTVGIWSKNCPSMSLVFAVSPVWGYLNRNTDAYSRLADWLLVDLAAQAYGKVGVPLYDTLGADSVGTSATPRMCRWSLLTSCIEYVYASSVWHF